MPKQLLVVMSDATDGRDDEFNDWYDNTHLGEVLRLEGVHAAQRFALTPGTDPPLRRYLALYEVEADDLQDVMDRLGKATAAGEIYMSDTLDSPVVWFANAIGERVTGSS